MYFEGCSPSSDLINLNLILINNHFRVIKSLVAAFSCKYFCEFCLKGYQRITDHRCVFKCNSCLQSPPCDKSAMQIECNSCNRKFFGPICFENHLQQTCQKIKRCISCDQTHIQIGRETHECGMTFCKLCCKKRPQNHECFIPVCKPILRKNILYLFYDMESVISAEDQSGLAEHFPNCCISQVVCQICINIDDTNHTCNNCGVRERIFIERCFTNNCKGSCLLHDFFEYVFSLIRKGFYVIMMAHNGGFYDSHILLKYIFNHTDVFHEIPELITKGQKIYCIKTSRFKIIDSLNFFNTALKTLPAMFGFNDEKRSFPLFI